MSNPIIQRELIGLLRTRRAYLLQILLVIALAALVLLRWPSDAHVNLTGDQAQQVLQLFAYGLMAGLILLAPVFPASSVVRERQSGTLALLLNTPLSTFDILIGKLLGVLGYVLILLVLSLPAAAACWTMGGISLTSQLLLAYTILALLAIQYASVALYISTRAGSTDSALRTTYGIVLLMSVVALGPHQFNVGLVGAPWGEIIDWIRCISPIPAMMEVMGHGGVASRGLMNTNSLSLRYIILAVLSIGVFNVLTALRLNMRMFDRPRNAGRVTDDRSARVQAYRRIMYLWFFDPQRRSGLIGPLTNPVMAKEFRSNKFGRSHWMMRLVGGCLIVSLGLMLATARSSPDWGVQTLGGILVVLQIALIILVTPTLACGLISSERESGGWQLLQMTPLSAGTIVRGKLMAVVRTLVLLLLATLPGYAMMVLIDPEQMARAVKVISTLLLTAAFAVLLSAAASSFFRRTATATAASYTILMVLCAGTMLFWLGRNAPFTRDTVRAVLLFNPLAAALEAIGAPGFSDYNLLPTTWYLLGAGSVLALFALIVQTWRLTRPQ